jgi:alpha/beta superfamily hydrolase
MELQVSFSSEGEAIFGVLHVPEQTPAAGVIMCHGFTGHKAEAHRLFVATARDFCQHGLAALRFDFRGSGDSAGEFQDMTVSREVADASAALDFLASRPEVDRHRLGVLGLSLGGCVAACLAGQDERVRALVLWAAVARPGPLFDRLSSELGDGEVLDMAGWPVGRGLLEDLQHVDPLQRAKQYSGSCLVVHGTADESVPPIHGSDYQRALSGQCRLHHIEGSDHVFSSLTWKSEAIAVSRAFLCESLAVSV